MAIAGVAGVGIVSPLGSSAAEHVFHARARLRPAAASPFVLEDESPIAVLYCQDLGAHEPVTTRLAHLAHAAAAEAIGDYVGEHAVLLCTSKPRPGLDVDALGDAARAVGAPLATRAPERFWGDAGGLDAIALAGKILSSRKAPAVLLVAVDSFVSREAIEARVRRAPSPWAMDPPPPAEGAAAVLLMPPIEARRAGRDLGTIEGLAGADGRSTDDDDEVVDGAALSTVMRGLPAAAPIAAVFGQGEVDELRHREWHLASARLAGRFSPALTATSLERLTGRVGAVAGLMSLAYGLAVCRHGAAAPAQRGLPLMAWAISPDGRRAAALARGAVS